MLSSNAQSRGVLAQLGQRVTGIAANGDLIVEMLELQSKTTIRSSSYNLLVVCDGGGSLLNAAPPQRPHAGLLALLNQTGRRVAVQLQPSCDHTLYGLAGFFHNPPSFKASTMSNQPRHEGVYSLEGKTFKVQTRFFASDEFSYVAVEVGHPRLKELLKEPAAGKPAAVKEEARKMRIKFFTELAQQMFTARGLQHSRADFVPDREGRLALSMISMQLGRVTAAHGRFRGGFFRSNLAAWVALGDSVVAPHFLSGYGESCW